VARSGERPTHALLRGGVQYVEVRALDVSAFDPVGVNQNALRFMETFLALCLLRTSPPIAAGEQALLDGNHVAVAHRGRAPALDLVRDGRPVPLEEWALELIDSMRGLAELLDAGDTARPYTAALEVQEAKVRDVTLTPSALSLRELDENGEGFADYALRMSRVHKAYFMDLYPPDEARLAEFRAEAAASLERQAAVEAADTLSFDEYLARYFAS